MDHKRLKETADATNALLAWFETQEIEPTDAVTVMALAIAGIIKAIGREKMPNNRKGVDVVAAMIAEMMDSMEIGQFVSKPRGGRS